MLNYAKLYLENAAHVTGSLERMLSNHSQSMFEYLAPRRGGGGAQGHGGAPHPPQPQNHGKPPNNDGYKEMVY